MSVHTIPAQRATIQGENTETSGNVRSANEHAPGREQRPQRAVRDTCSTCTDGTTLPWRPNCNAHGNDKRVHCATPPTARHASMQVESSRGGRRPNTYSSRNVRVVLLKLAHDMRADLNAVVDAHRCPPCMALVRHGTPPTGSSSKHELSVRRRQSCARKSQKGPKLQLPPSLLPPLHGAAPNGKMGRVPGSGHYPANPTSPQDVKHASTPANRGDESLQWNDVTSSGATRPARGDTMQPTGNGCNNGGGGKPAADAPRAATGRPPPSRLHARRPATGAHTTTNRVHGSTNTDLEKRRAPGDSPRGDGDN